jgi:hypothetical protein
MSEIKTFPKEQIQSYWINKTRNNTKVLQTLLQQLDTEGLSSVD